MKAFRFLMVIAIVVVSLLGVSRAALADGPVKDGKDLPAVSQQDQDAAKGVEAKGDATEIAFPTGALLGDWRNANPSTPAVTRIILRGLGQNVAVRAFGKCSPTDCDWGTVTGSVYATTVGSNLGIGFSAVYNFSFKQTIMVGYLSGGNLYVLHFNRFTDNSGRSNYFMLERFHK